MAKNNQEVRINWPYLPLYTASLLSTFVLMILFGWLISGGVEPGRQMAVFQQSPAADETAIRKEGNNLRKRSVDALDYSLTKACRAKYGGSSYEEACSPVDKNADGLIDNNDLRLLMEALSGQLDDEQPKDQKGD